MSHDTSPPPPPPLGFHAPCMYVCVTLLSWQEYLYLEFPSETTTRSGYNIKRKNFVVAGVKRDKLYVLAARWAVGSDYDRVKRCNHVTLQRSLWQHSHWSDDAFCSILGGVP